MGDQEREEVLINDFERERDYGLYRDVNPDQNQDFKEKIKKQLGGLVDQM